MVNILLLCTQPIKATLLLRLLVKAIRSEISYFILKKTDFAGEALIEMDGIHEDKSVNSAKKKVIHPNKVIIVDERTGLLHTIFAPSLSPYDPIQRMGLITISRIAEYMTLVLSIKNPEKQLSVIDRLRSIPEKVFVTVVLTNEDDAEDPVLERIVRDYFKEREVNVLKIYYIPNLYSDNSVGLVLNLFEEIIGQINKDKKFSEISKL